MNRPTMELEEEIMFYDTDCGGVVHNLAYLRLIEKARTILARRMGMDMRGMAGKGHFPVLLSTEAQYKKPAVLGDFVLIKGALTQLERVRFHVEFQVERPADSSLLVTCRQSLALVAMPEGKPLRLPAAWDCWR